MKMLVGLTAMALAMFGCAAEDPTSGGADTPTVSSVEETVADVVEETVEGVAEDTAARREPIISTGADEIYDLIRIDDPNALACLIDQGQGLGEFYDKGIDDLVFPPDTWFFDARYTDGVAVEIRVHPDLGPQIEARENAQRIADAVGRLPAELRVGVERIGILGGDFGAQADGGGEGIHLYADNVAVRLAANRLEETIFHESVHTSFDDAYASDSEWLAAQAADGVFLTTYGRDNPRTEDLAESALYAYALLYHPDRIPAPEAAAWRERIPRRISFIESVLPAATNQPPNGEVDCS